jgi:hypothetical protein
MKGDSSMVAMAANTPAAGFIEVESNCWDAKRVAGYFGVSVESVKGWARKGLLKPLQRRAAKDKMFFPIDDVKAFTPPSGIK